MHCTAGDSILNSFYKQFLQQVLMAYGSGIVFGTGAMPLSKAKALSSRSLKGGVIGTIRKIVRQRTMALVVPGPFFH